VSDVVVWREAGGDDLEDGYKKFWWGRFLRSVKSGVEFLTDGVGGVNFYRSWLR
jgi:hypothetical protein